MQRVHPVRGAFSAVLSLAMLMAMALPVLATGDTASDLRLTSICLTPDTDPATYDLYISGDEGFASIEVPGDVGVMRVTNGGEAPTTWEPKTPADVTLLGDADYELAAGETEFFAVDDQTVTVVITDTVTGADETKAQGTEACQETEVPETDLQLTSICLVTQGTDEYALFVGYDENADPIFISTEVSDGAGVVRVTNSSEVASAVRFNVEATALLSYDDAAAPQITDADFQLAPGEVEFFEVPAGETIIITDDDGDTDTKAQNPEPCELAPDPVLDVDLQLTSACTTGDTEGNYSVYLGSELGFVEIGPLLPDTGIMRVTNNGTEASTDFSFESAESGPFDAALVYGDGTIDPGEVEAYEVPAGETIKVFDDNGDLDDTKAQNDEACELVDDGNGGDPGDGDGAFLRLTAPTTVEDTEIDGVRVFADGSVSITGDTIPVAYETNLDRTGWGIFAGTCEPLELGDIIAGGNEPTDHEITADTPDGNYCLLLGAEAAGSDVTNPDDLQVGAQLVLDRGEPTNPGGGNTDDDPRVAGTNRVSTAIEVSERAYPNGADYAFVARDDIYPDALAAGPLAAGYEGPILLTDSDDLTDATEAELARLDAGDGQDDLTVVILGESMAVSDAVEAEIAEDHFVDRVGGVNRFETAALIADELQLKGIVDTAYVATARDFPDAMVAGWAAGLTDGAVLLSNPDEVSSFTTEALADLEISTVYVVGGDAVIDDSVVSALSATRVAGPDRYATTVEVANMVFDLTGNPDTIYLTTGVTFPDTLAVAPLAILGSDGIVLTMPDALPSVVADALDAWAPDTVIAIGGPAAVNDAVLDAAAQAAG